MIISGWHIEGFGLFRDMTVRDLPDGLVVFHGPNEAGKSTLLGFIRAMIFGFPRANAREPQYPPLAGGRQGGRLILKPVDGRELTVERFHGQKGGPVTYTDDGEKGGDEDLHRLMGGTSATVFKNIFAFSLNELQDQAGISDTGLKGAIYGAGGAAARSLPVARKKIVAGRGALFLPGGQKPLINRLLSDLEGIRHELRSAIAEAGKFDRATAALEEIDSRLNRCRRSLARLTADRGRTGDYLKIWSDWLSFTDAEKGLKNLQGAGPFPDQGLKQYEALQNRLTDQETRLVAIRKAAEKARTDIARLETDENVLMLGDAIEAISRGLDRYETARNRHPLVEQDLAATRDSVRRLIGGLGNDWSETKTGSLDRSIFTRDAIHRFQERLRSCDESVVRAGEILEIHRKALARAERERDEAMKRLAGLVRSSPVADDFGIDAGPVPDNRCHAQPEKPAAHSERLRNRRAGLNRLRDLILRQDHIDGDLSHLVERLADKEAERRRMSATEAPVPGHPLWGLPLAAGALLAIPLSFSRPETTIPVVAGFFLLSLAAGIWLWLRRRRAAQLNTDLMRMLAALDTSLIEIRASLADRTTVRAGIQAEITETLSGLEMTRPVSLRDISEAQARTEALLETCNHWQRKMDEAGRVLKEREEIVTQSAHEADSAAKDLEKAGQHRQTTLEEWRSWLDSSGFARTLLPSTALEALEIIDNALVALGRRDTLEQQAKELRGQIETYENQAQDIFTAAGREAPPPDRLATAVESLHRDYRRFRENAGRIEEIRPRLADLETEAVSISEIVGQTGTGIQQLLTAAGVAEEAAFRERAAAVAREQSLQEQCDRALAGIRAVFGADSPDGLRDMLSSATRETLLAQEKTLSLAFEERQQERESLLQQRAELQHFIDRLQTSDTIIRLREEEERLLAEIVPAARKWCCLAIAGHLLDTAREKFEKEQQPKVIRDASTFFSRITAGRYSRVSAPIGEDRLEVIAADGGRKSPDTLSRGTAEQLYLAIRFGCIRHRAETSEPLPVVMDDILVNFDPDRSLRAAEAVIELSRTHQILLFTCHPETIERFQTIREDVPIYDLNAYI